MFLFVKKMHKKEHQFKSRALDGFSSSHKVAQLQGRPLVFFYTQAPSVLICSKREKNFMGRRRERVCRLSISVWTYVTSIKSMEKWAN